MRLAVDAGRRWKSEEEQDKNKTQKGGISRDLDSVFPGVLVIYLALKRDELSPELEVEKAGRERENGGMRI